MAVQTTVTAPGFAYPGLLYDSGFNNYMQSFGNASGVTIDFGLGVVRGSQDRAATLPNAEGNEFLGITVRNEMRENTFVNFQSGSSPYQIGEMMTVLTKQGQIWVVAENTVSAGDPVYCRFAVNGGLNILGSFRNDSNTTLSVAYAFLVPNAIWNSSVSAGGYARILFPK